MVDSVIGIIAVLVLLAVVIPLLVHASQQSKVQEIQDANLQKSQEFEENIVMSGFNVDKKIERPETSSLFLVDDSQKKWTVKTYQQSYCVFSYNELLSFELIENEESIATATLDSIITGGRAFEGDKRIQATCSMMHIHIRVDSLQSPQVIIPIVVAPALKNTPFYRKAVVDAQEILATLTYIENHK